MRTRILPPEEWPRVPGQMSAILPYTEPENIAVVVVENDEGEIVASCSALQVTLFEGLWIKPEERKNAGVIRSLLRQLYAIPGVRHEHWSLASIGSDNERMNAVCHRIGGREIEGQFYMVPVNESR